MSANIIEWLGSPHQGPAWKRMTFPMARNGAGKGLPFLFSPRDQVLEEIKRLLLQWKNGNCAIWSTFYRFGGLWPPPGSEKAKSNGSSVQKLGSNLRKRKGFFCSCKQEPATAALSPIGRVSLSNFMTSFRLSSRRFFSQGKRSGRITILTIYWTSPLTID